MYNLLISGSDESWSDGHWAIERSRYLEYTDDVVKARFAALDAAAQSVLTTAPALFAYESYHDLPATLGRITAIHVDSRTVAIDYILYPELKISAHDFNAGARRLGITSDWEFNRTHWAVKNVDLFASGLFKAAPPPPPLSSRVFVVHGHDHDLKDLVAAEITRHGLEPVILHREANKGRTVIEKFEQSSDVGFAVVLLTPDDAVEGGGMRARQNVILELGYFTGKLGRSRVCALRKGRVEMPSDIVGVIYTPVDDAGEWRHELARELDAAGYPTRSLA